MKKTLTVEKIFSSGTKEVSRQDFISKWVGHASELHWMNLPGGYEEFIGLVKTEAGRRFDELLEKEQK